MTLASDAIVPLAARAVARRTGVGGTIAAGPTGNADPKGLQSIASVSEADPSSARMLTHSDQTVVRRTSAAAIEGQRPTRPALHLVSPNDPAAPADAESLSNDVPSRSRAIGRQAALLATAAKALDRRHNAGSAMQLDRPEKPSSKAAIRRQATDLDQTPSPEAPVSLRPMTHAARRTGSASALPGHPQPTSNAFAESAMPQTGTGHPANPATVMDRPSDVSRHTVRARTALESDAATIRPTEDPKDRIAQLLMPTMPAIVPETVNAGPEPESDFEFEMRVRAALEKILSQDLLRHGLIAPEVL